MSDKRKQAARQMMKDHPGMTYCGALNQMRRERELQAPAAIDQRPAVNGAEAPAYDLYTQRDAAGVGRFDRVNARKPEPMA